MTCSPQTYHTYYHEQWCLVRKGFSGRKCCRGIREFPYSFVSTVWSRQAIAENTNLSFPYRAAAIYTLVYGGWVTGIFNIATAIYFYVE